MEEIANYIFTCFILDMNIHPMNNISSVNSFKSTNKPQKKEFIDRFLDVVQNQSDVNDCVAVPRGIFKAYLWIMGGFGLLGISGALPQKFAKTKSALSIIGNICNAISAFYFAKPFAFKGVSPTIRKDQL